MGSMDKSFVRLSLIGVIVVGLAFGWVTKAWAVNMLPPTVQVPDPVAQAVQALLDTTNPAPNAAYYVITDVTLKRVYLVSVAGVTTDTWTLADAVWVGIIAVDPQNNYQAALRGTPEFDTMTDGILEGGGGGSGQELPMFPLEPGKKFIYGTRGVHGGSTWTAIDLVSGYDLGDDFAPNSVYAAASGTITYVCRDDYQVGVYTDDYMYLHLKDNAFLKPGSQLVRGMPFASMVEGSIPSSAPCGWAEQQPDHYHVHWGFKPQGDTFAVAGGWILDLNTGIFHNGSQSVSPGQVITAPGVDDGSSVGTPDSGTSFWDPLVDLVIRMMQRILVHFPTRQGWMIGMYLLSAARMTVRTFHVLLGGVFDLTIPVLVITTIGVVEIIRILMTVYFLVRKVLI